MTHHIITLLLISTQSILVFKSLQYSKKAYLIANEISKNLQFKTLTKTFYLDEIDKDLEKIFEKLNK